MSAGSGRHLTHYAAVGLSYTKVCSGGPQGGITIKCARQRDSHAPPRRPLTFCTRFVRSVLHRHRNHNLAAAQFSTREEGSAAHRHRARGEHVIPLSHTLCVTRPLRSATAPRRGRGRALAAQQGESKHGQGCAVPVHPRASRSRARSKVATRHSKPRLGAALTWRPAPSRCVCARTHSTQEHGGVAAAAATVVPSDSVHPHPPIRRPRPRPSPLLHLPDVRFLPTPK